MSVLQLIQLHFSFTNFAQMQTLPTLNHQRIIHLTEVSATDFPIGNRYKYKCRGAVIALRKWVRTFEIAEALIFKDFFLLPSALEPSAFCYRSHEGETLLERNYSESKSHRNLYPHA